MPLGSNHTSLSSPSPSLWRKYYTTPPKTRAYNPMNSRFAKIATPPPPPNQKNKLATSSIGIRKCQWVHNTQCSHCKHLRRYTQKQHYQPLQTMLHTFNAHTLMHTTSPHDCYQIPYLNHTQQTKTGTPSTPGYFYLNKYKLQNPKNEANIMLPKPTQIIPLMG
jgi:hypothetical protein